MKLPIRKADGKIKKIYMILAGCGVVLLAAGVFLNRNMAADADTPSAITTENATYEFYEVFSENGLFADSYNGTPEGRGTSLITYTQAAPNGTYTIKSGEDKSISTTYSSENADSIYCSPGDSFYVENWNPSIVSNWHMDWGYFRPDDIVGNEKFSYRCSYQRVSNLYSGTYYIISKDPIRLADLQKDFVTYILKGSTNLGNNQYAITIEGYTYKFAVKDGKYLYGLSSNANGSGSGSNFSGVSRITKWLNQKQQEFLTEDKGAISYDPNIGVVLADQNNSQNITVIRTNVLYMGWDYYKERYIRNTESDPWSYNGSTWYENYMGVPMISASNYKINMKQATETPTVKSESGTPYYTYTENQNSVLSAASVKVNYDSETYGNGNIDLYYYLTTTDYTSEEVLSMDRWTELKNGASISLSGLNLSGTNRYLYVMLKSKKEFGKYKDSAVAKYMFVFDKEKPSGEITLGVSGGTTDGVDVGDVVEIVNTNEEAMMLYTSDGTNPVLERFIGNGTISLDDLNQAAPGTDTAYVTDQSTEYNFLRVNNYWYRCSKSVKQYTDSITIDTEIRQNNRLLIKAMPVQEGYELGDYVLLTLPYQLKKTVENPMVDIPTTEEEPAEIKMGDAVNFSCTTFGSEIFYTTNGSAPVVTTKKQEDGTYITVPGNSSTKKAEAGTSAVVTEEFATYGSNVTFMVKAVCYDESGYRTMNDSDVVRFIYHVGNQSPIEPVQAIPETDAANPTIIAAGSTIMLYCDTKQATIYYTIDGTEPVRNEDGTLAENTYKYDAAKGIVVPKQQDTLFTITAMAYAEGLATSDMVRFVYKYPAAVSAPYATPGSGTVVENTSVVLKSSTEGAVVYYELAYDGKEPQEPTENSSVFDEENPIVITRETKIKAISIKDGTSSTVKDFSYSVSSKLSVPSPSIKSGSVIANGSSITLTGPEGATIYYTTDGSNPADAENANVNIGNTVFLDGETGSVITIRTYAAKTGYSNSEIGNYSYTISNYENAIFANKENGAVVKNGETVTLNTDVTGASIYYTLDGSMPTTRSICGNVVTITGASGSTVMLKAIAVVPGTTRTAAVANFTFTITEKLKAPQSNVPSGAVFTEPGQVVLSAEQGTIYYTTDGTEPSTNSNMFQESITVNKGMTIRAIAVSEDADASDVSTFTYQFADQVAMPEASEESGQLELETEITLSCETKGAMIYYTVNGVDPDPDNLENAIPYTGAISVNKAMTLKAIAVKEGMRDSKVLTVGYTVKEPVVVEEGNEIAAEETEGTTSNGRLQSRNTFEAMNEGPTFKDIILKNATYGVMVDSSFQSIPENTELIVNKTQADNSANNMIKQSLGEYYQAVSSYEISLWVSGEQIQPEGEVEIGLPIPTEYENAIIHIVYVAEDGTVEVQETRRSGTMAYAKVKHFSQYAIAAPMLEEEGKQNGWKVILIGAGIVAVITAIIAVIIRHYRKYYDR